MPRRKENGIGPKAEARRLDIVRRSAQLFDERGVDLVSMTDIADEVGLAKPSLYHYFPSKEQILYSIHSGTITQLLGSLRARLEASDDPAVLLKGVMEDMFDLLDSHPGHARVFFEYSRRLSPELLAPVREDQRQYDSEVTNIIERGIAKGVFRSVDARVASRAIFGMANWSYQWFDPKGKYASKDLADQFFDIFINGMSSQS